MELRAQSKPHSKHEAHYVDRIPRLTYRLCRVDQGVTPPVLPKERRVITLADINQRRRIETIREATNPANPEKVADT